MMGRRTFGAIVMGGVTALLSGCGLSGRDSLRYKMTVEVDTPAGVKSGYAVRQMNYYSNEGGYAGRGKLTIKGEAVAVDLGGGKTLFALLTGQDGYVDYAANGVSTVLRVMDRDVGPKGGPHELWPKVPVIREPITDPLPMLVTFRDITDPKSVEKVDPSDLAAAFGPGVKLRRITVTVTDEAVTSGIGKRLGWFRKRAASGGGLIPMQKSKSGRYEVVPGYDASLSEIGLSDFSTEAYK